MNFRNSSNDRRPRYLVIISLDGLSSSDLEIIKTLPNFNEILTTGSYARKVLGVYPTQTYPIHTSLITGVFPNKHGIATNTRFTPGATKPDWFWFGKDIQVPTLYDVARDANLKVGSLLWPGTAGAQIDYHFPIIMPKKRRFMLPILLLRNGTPGLISYSLLRFGYLLSPMAVYGFDNCFTDNFVAAAASFLIRNRNPNLLLVYMLELDQKRHLYGASSRIAQKAIYNHDIRLGKILKASKEAGTFKNTAFFIIGDHGHFNAKYRININVAFKEARLITIDRIGKVSNWKAWANCKGGSAQIRLKKKDDETLRREVYRILTNLKDDPKLGIDRIYCQEDIHRLKVSDDIDFVLEAKPGFYFSNHFNRKIIEPAEKKHKSVHGYRPELAGNQALFLAAGAGIRKGVVLPKINHVDLAPTAASLLGLKMKEVDGRTLTSIIKQ